jgi:adenosylmethionine-8-amino-7-oxononanoate aminotransferase
MNPIARLDHRYVWHPFTQMRDWLAREPIVIVEGKGTVLRDIKGKEYLDANSSIWTNLHGHNHPVVNRAIRSQLGKIAHSSALGLANKPAAILAQRLIQLANVPAASANSKAAKASRKSGTPPLPTLQKAFFSDNGSTAMEVALKLAFEFSRRTRGTKKPRFLSLQGGYHGDTVGAVSLGHIDLFHKAYRPLLFKTDSVAAPYCYRCPWNRARPERADARAYRKCNWECVGVLEKKFAARKRKGNPYAAFVFEPLVQGAAGIIPQPAGWLRRAAEVAADHGALLVADEVLTAFGRTGGASGDSSNASGGPRLLACQQERVRPDFVALAKGLSGGYLPLAATLTTQKVFDAFLGEYSEFKTFFHGHSFTANQLGCSAALASLNLLQSRASIRARQNLERVLEAELQGLWKHTVVGDIRRVGLVAGIELVKNWRTREPFRLEERAGIRVCEAMARRGVLTRPIGNVIVVMPPYCTTKAQVQEMISVLGTAIAETL